MKQHDPRKGAHQFIKTWSGKGYEKGENQPFWLSLLKDIFGVENPENLLVFEQPVFKRDEIPARRLGFIDAWIPSSRVLIEQKGLGHALDKTQKQSDGSMLTPFQQGKRYADNLTTKNRPRWIIACNFESFEIHDLDNEDPNAKPEVILLKDLETEYYRLGFLVDSAHDVVKAETKLSVAAGEIVGRLYNGLLAQYINPDSEEVRQSINKLCVRLVFCLYAEDALLFKTKSQFHDYLKGLDLRCTRYGLQALFRVLNTPEDQRDPYDDPMLLDFPYVNGGLFADDAIIIPQLTPELKELLLSDASENFNWAEISPTIFGAVFESTLNPDTRRKGGMHYTSVENIEKVINPLFMDDLNREFAEIMRGKQAASRMRRLKAFQEKLGKLRFLDPACGSGNFLTETYLQLRRLENKVILELNAGAGQFDFGGEHSPVKVQINQFYGIEINDFACSVAQTALWIAESQMLKETEDIIGAVLDFFPLKSFTNIREGNALRFDWRTLLPEDGSNFTFIMGNPPFSGARLMTDENKADVKETFGSNWANAGNIDYVGCWFKRAVEIMQGTTTRTAFVATNSLSQGEQVANLWKPLVEQYGAHIDFAYRTFRWDSEAQDKAHVHVVIEGFSTAENSKPRVLFDGADILEVPNINAYLLDGPDCFVASRSTPLCDVPEIGIGNQPIDDGNYLFTEEEKNDFVKKEPLSEAFFKPWYGSFEFINRAPRWCLWLGDCPAATLAKMPLAKARVAAVRRYRLNSSREGTKKLADTPRRFLVENMPSSNYILVPSVSSERRRYVPMGFMTPDALTSNLALLIPNATLYHFGILTSSVHMAWMRAVAGRLKSDYRYSKDIVYNNFVWPEVMEKLREKIERTAQKILDARAAEPDASLAVLYDDDSMPDDLRAAHAANDRLVLEAYGLSGDSDEATITAHLMNLYVRKATEVDRRDAVEATLVKILGKGCEGVPEWLSALHADALAGKITPEELLEQGRVLKKAQKAK
ncbi:DNA methyltransferase [uncultured Sutterella sp.]|uniref:DNA methyltransferase n=1 Tax=uncultured Sutterella sp. TaxID=286133 RepID=UPI0025FDCF04|nr:DNA methyltransferase [uncultured Sutterella sp.]